MELAKVFSFSSFSSLNLGNFFTIFATSALAFIQCFLTLPSSLNQTENDSLSFFLFLYRLISIYTVFYIYTLSIYKLSLRIVCNLFPFFNFLSKCFKCDVTPFIINHTQFTKLYLFGFLSSFFFLANYFSKYSVLCYCILLFHFILLLSLLHVCFPNVYYLI